METVYQLMMGVSLAACAGVRATLPMLAVCILARSNHGMLNGSYEFLRSDGMLIILSVATVLEFLGDKFIAIDHFLDVIGTLARPVAGTLLTASLLTKVDPQTALMLGLVAGGATAFTVHAGKSATRVKTSLFAPLHAGLGNLALSFGEDAMVVGGIVAAVLAPVLAIFLASALVGLAVVMVVLAMKTGQHLMNLIWPVQSEPALAVAR
jgi:hypothetical protein